MAFWHNFCSFNIVQQIEKILHHSAKFISFFIAIAAIFIVILALGSIYC